MKQHQALIAKLAAAVADYRHMELTADLYESVLGCSVIRGPHHVKGVAWRYRPYGENRWCSMADLADSVDRAMRHIPAGTYCLFGAGKAKPTEPLYGAILYSADDRSVELGKGEHEHSLAIALWIAILDSGLPVRKAR